MRPASMCILVFFCCWVLFAGLSFAADKAIPRVANPETRLALVMGNGAYKSGPLKNPTNDALDMAELLSRFGFQVILRQNVGLREMKRSIRAFEKQLGQGGVGLFYFSGHGMQVRGRNYLIPVDAEIYSENDVEYESVDAGRVLDAMRTAGNSLNLVILDACRDNPFSKSFRTQQQGLARMDAPTGTIIAYATSPGSVAADGEARNGVYTGSLLRHLPKPDLKIEDALKRVRKDVISITENKQIPWESTSLTGDFFLAKTLTAPAKPRINGAAQPGVAARDAGRIDKEADLLFWESVKDSDDPDLLQLYLEKFPKGVFAALAEVKISKLKAKPAKPQQPDPRKSETRPGRNQTFLSVNANIQGANVLVDGELAGKTPLVKKEIIPGRHEARIRQDGFADFTAPFQANAGENITLYGYLAKIREPEQTRTEIQAPPEPQAARLFVEPEPGGARIRILNIKPLFRQGMELAPGKYHIETSSSGHKTDFRWVAVKAGEETRIPVALEKLPEPSRLFVNTTPKDARIQIANKNLPFYQGMELAGDRYQIKISAKGYETVTQWVALKAGETKTIAITLESSGPKRGDVWKDPYTGMEFVWVPGGCYEMGCGSWSGDCDDDEKPLHEVCLDGFWMGKYEVTQGQWKKVMGSNPSHFPSCGSDCPVESVSWNDTKNFIQRLNNRSSATFKLPTEAQWEYAARSGGKKEKYSGGSNIYYFAWYGDNSGRKSHRVGTKSPNGLGIYDMIGNVWEWCVDVYDKNAYSKHSRNNPVSTSGSAVRVVRGGGYYSNAENSRVSNRYSQIPSFRSYYIGFRLVAIPAP